MHIQLYGFRPVPVTDRFGGGCPRYDGVSHHIIAHEFGHAMGFRHTRNQPGMMNTLAALSAGQATRSQAPPNCSKNLIKPL